MSYDLQRLTSTSDFIATLQYQLALYQIDSLRQDGKFIGIDGSTPEGQGIVMAHLNECHELLEMVCYLSNTLQGNPFQPNSP